MGGWAYDDGKWPAAENHLVARLIHIVLFRLVEKAATLAENGRGITIH